MRLVCTDTLHIVVFRDTEICDQYYAMQHDLYYQISKTDMQSAIENVHLLSLLPENSNLVGSMLVIFANLSTISEVLNILLTSTLR